jgi:hypothetical protein
MSKKVEPFFKYIKREYKPIVITEVPDHGTHASRTKKIEKPEDIKEALKPSLETFASSRNNPNKHIGQTHDEVHQKLDLHSTDFEKKHGEKGTEALHRYSSASRDINTYLIHKHINHPGEDGYGTSLMGPIESGLANKYKKHLKENPWVTPHDLYDDPHHEHWHQMQNKYHAIKDIEENVKRLDKALNKPVGHELTVFHGTKNWHPGQEAAKHPEGHIMLPAYTSTSIKQQTAAGFASPIHTSKTRGHVLKIHLKPDDKGVYLGSNSSFDNEKEMLLPRKTVLKIHKTPEVYHDHEPHEEWDNDKQDYVKTGTTKKKVFIWHAHVVHQGDDEHGN